MHSSWFWLSVAALLLSLVMVACGGNGAAPSATPRITVTPTPDGPAPTPSPVDTPTVTAQPVAPTATLVPGGSARVVRRADTSEKVVALTFDAGSDTGFTAQILETLSAHGIVASFGITGRWAQENPELLQRIAREGHELMNHTYSHPSFTGYSTGEAALSQGERWDQLDRTDAIIEDLTGRGTKPYFRPPYGDYDASVNSDVYARGYRYSVMWTVDSLGWQGTAPSEIAERCLRLAEPGAIYLLHVGSASQDAAALEPIISGLREDGYSFAPVSQLIEE